MAFPWLAAAALGATGLGIFGQSSANRASARSAFDAGQHSQAMAREQMSFQERMSSTAMQRAKQDLIAAGFNPALAYMQGGASTPAGASGTAQAARAENAFSGAAVGAKDAMLMKAQIQNMGANTANLLASANLANTSARKVEAEIPVVGHGGLWQSATTHANAFARHIAENIKLKDDASVSSAKQKYKDAHKGKSISAKELLLSGGDKSLIYKR